MATIAYSTGRLSKTNDFETGRTLRPGSTEPLWRTHDRKAQKAGQRNTIYWVGKSIVGEDGAATGARIKGTSYSGEWDDNKKSGYGVQVSPTGQKYEGQWLGGQRHGEGTLWVPAGKKLRKLYVGGWRHDKRHGRGSCFFKSGEFFQGSWEDGRMHGQGTLRYANGDLYIGEWSEGQRSGQGTLNKANGDCYEGSWLADKREGNGSFFYAASGKVFVGEWANDLPKAGVYTQASANPEQAAPVPQTTTLPRVRLAVPSQVLEQALGAVRAARKSVRAQATPLHRLFSVEETAALRAAFDGAQGTDNTVQLSDLAALLAELGTEVTVARARQLMAVAGMADSEGVGFDGFLRVVALLLEEEAAMVISQEEMVDEPWEEEDGAEEEEGAEED
mmetsp:Transcript_5957/g.14142  ORF Transcript_5957/g.14142 Transcript_5957/m.14142 type:complete len:390 (+) Transcript_5957:36-1205(+)